MKWIVAGTVVIFATLAGLYAVLYVTIVITGGVWLWSRLLPKRTHPVEPDIGKLACFEDVLDAGLLIGEGEASQALVLGSTTAGDFVGVVPVLERPTIGHAAIVGPSQSGKSTMAVAQLLMWGGSAIVSDPRGELYRQTAGYRATLGPVRMLDPARGYGHRYDPLEARQGASELRAFAHTVLSQPGDERSGGSAHAAIASRLLVKLVTEARGKGVPTWPYLSEKVRADRSQEAASLDARLGGLIDETTIAVMAGSDVQASDFDRPFTLYCRWPELADNGALVRAMLLSLLREVLAHRDETPGCHTPLLVVLDEASSLSLPDLPDLAAQCAGRYVSLWLSLQAESQLTALYGEAGASSILASMHSAVYFRPLAYSAAMRLSERIGRQLVMRKAYSEGLTLGGMTNMQSTQETEFPLMPAEVLSRLPDSDVIAFSRDAYPMVLKALTWRSDEELRRRRDVEPAPIPRLSPELGIRKGKDNGTTGIVEKVTEIHVPSPSPLEAVPAGAFDRVWSMVEQRREHDCWGIVFPVGVKGTDSQGYPRIKFEGTYYRTYRLVYEHFHGPLAKGDTVEHACHTRDTACVGGISCEHRKCHNPRHLVKLSASDNAKRKQTWARQTNQRRKGLDIWRDALGDDDGLAPV